MATHRPVSPISLNEQKPAPAQGMSPQTRQTIAIVGLVLCLLIGGGIVYWFMFGSTPKPRTITVDPAAQAPENTGARSFVRTQRRATMIVKDDDKSWLARGNSGAMRVSQDGNNFKFEMFFPGRDFLTPDQVALVSGFVRAKRDEAMAKEWGISADQITRLKAIDLGVSTIVISDKERGDLRTLWDEYLKAADGQPKTDVEKKVIARLDELGKTNLEVSRKAFAQRLEQIKAVLTPQQVEKITAR